MVIKKNTHAPLRFPRFYTEHQPIRYEIEFTESCKYRFGTDDDNDINKLFGVAFITWGSVWFVIKNLFKGKFKALHHYNSIRYGWRYDALSNRFGVWQYYYTNGNRVFNYVDGLNVGESLRLYILPINEIANKVEYSLSVIYYGEFKIFNQSIKFPSNCLMYQLHPYFGGNRKATQDMEIKMKRL